MCTLALILVFAAAGDGAGPAAGAYGWWLLPSAREPGPLEAQAGLAERLEHLPMSFVPMPQVLERLRQADQGREVRSEAETFFRRAREHHLALRLPEAIENYRRAAGILLSGFTRFTDPDLLAEPLLRLGEALFVSGLADEARKMFQRAAAMVPHLAPNEDFFGPSVLAAYREARAEMGTLPPEMPHPRELSRLAQAAGLQGLLVVSAERLAERTVLQAGLFDAASESFRAVETVVVEPGAARACGERLAERLASSMLEAGVFSLPPVTDAAPGPADGGAGTDGGALPPADLALAAEAPDGGSGFLPGPDAGPTPDANGVAAPWYLRHWWIWPVAAAAVGAAVAVPLLLRQDVIDVRIHY
ncbi:MAG: hypothetical protein GYA21_18440 [Myxococcales bacterium]|nr:hypothetical protein [Myxococcales bacterium]